MFVITALTNCAVFVLAYPGFVSDGRQPAEAARTDELTVGKLYLVSEMPSGFFGSQVAKKNKGGSASDDDLGANKTAPVPYPGEKPFAGNDFND